MSNKHEKTIEAVRSRSATIPWLDIEAMFKSLGAYVEEREGSRVYIELNGIPSVFHRPHPEKEAGIRRVMQVRKVLENAGII